MSNDIIDSLPRDIVRLICKELDVISVISLRLSCKGFKHALLPYVEGGRQMRLEEIVIKTDDIIKAYFFDLDKRRDIKVSNKDIFDVFVSQIIRLGDTVGHANLYYLIASKQIIKGQSKSQCHMAISDVYCPYNCPYIDEKAQKELDAVWGLPMDEPWTPDVSSDEEAES